MYDTYNGLVIGYGPNDRPSNAVFSLLVSPGGWVTGRKAERPRDRTATSEQAGREVP
ncbi:MAG TPA: hypothetical protein VF424_17900 [Vicinamibacterales bacterium]